MGRIGEPNPLGKSVGLLVGLCGFIGVLLAPWLSAPWARALFWLAPLMALGSLALLIFRRQHRASVLVAVLLLCVVAAVLLAPALSAMPRLARSTLASAVLMAAWWITVAIPIPATSLLPLVLFPIFGILTSKETAVNYASEIIFLFMGGFILALGIQRWGLHRRIALHIVQVFGTNPSRMVLGFMVATAFLSMWISNTATSLMMLPIALAVVASLREVEGDRTVGFAPALLLGIAYSASIGGLATPIGTPPNISFLRIVEILFPDAPTISFGSWFLAILPVVLVFLPIAWLLLIRLFGSRVPRGSLSAGRGVIAEEIRGLGRMSGAERRMLWIFVITALLWITRGDLDLGTFRIPGWASLVETWLPGRFSAGHLHDATVAMGMALLTFLIPGDRQADGKRPALMDWETAVQLPWGILLLFGGGFALALAFKESGLAEYFAASFARQVGGLPPFLLVIATCLLLTFLTEVTSNTATTEVLLPILAGTATAMGVHPLLLMLPATLSASCAFMLPIATPPNAIVFSSGEVEIRDMVRAGLVLNLIGVLVIATIFFLVSSRLLGLDLSTMPLWATQ
jgi:sodium-dependent dicarboxylate transporter 2/3/5